MKDNVQPVRMSLWDSTSVGNIFWPLHRFIFFHHTISITIQRYRSQHLSTYLPTISPCNGIRSHTSYFFLKKDLAAPPPVSSKLLEFEKCFIILVTTLAPHLYLSYIWFYSFSPLNIICADIIVTFCCLQCTIQRLTQLPWHPYGIT